MGLMHCSAYLFYCRKLIFFLVSHTGIQLELKWTCSFLRLSQRDNAYHIATSAKEKTTQPVSVFPSCKDDCIQLQEMYATSIHFKHTLLCKSMVILCGLGFNNHYHTLNFAFLKNFHICLTTLPRKGWSFPFYI